MSVTLIILLVFAGLILVLLEILVVPGIGVVGILGGIMIIVAIIGAYNVSTTHGHLTLVASFLLSVILIYASIKTKTWKKMSLNNEISGRVNVRENPVKEGDTGITVSRINPMGKALINDNLYEVESKVGFIPENQEIEVIKTTQNKIIIKLKQLN